MKGPATYRVFCFVLMFSTSLLGAEYQTVVLFPIAIDFFTVDISQERHDGQTHGHLQFCRRTFSDAYAFKGYFLSLT